MHYRPFSRKRNINTLVTVTVYSYTYTMRRVGGPVTIVTILQLSLNGVVRWAPLAYHWVTRRISLAGSALSISEDVRSTNNADLAARGVIDF